MFCKTTPRAGSTCSTLMMSVKVVAQQSPQIWQCFAGEWKKGIWNRMVISLCGWLSGPFKVWKSIKNHGMPAGRWQRLELLAPKSQPLCPSPPFRNSPEDVPSMSGSKYTPEPAKPQRYSRKLRQGTVYYLQLWFPLSSKWKGDETYTGTFSVAQGCEEHSWSGPKVAF